MKNSSFIRPDLIPGEGGGGGTLKFSVYMGEAGFFGVKILNFQIFKVFRKTSYFFRVGSFLWIFFFWSCLF